jgi:hypothetical protein
MRLDAQSGEVRPAGAVKLGRSAPWSELFILFLNYMEDFFYGSGLQKPLAEVSTFEQPGYLC